MTVIPLHFLQRRPAVLLTVMTALAMWYGASLGSYAFFLPNHPGKWMQVFAAIVKVPLMLWGTLLLTVIPVLAANAVLATRLSAADLWRHWIRTMTVMTVLLTVESPITIGAGALRNYAFCVLLNYVLFSIAGLGAAFYLLRVIVVKTPSAPDAARGRKIALWIVWVCLFAVIGATIGWMLRPYIGFSGQPFTWLRAEQSSIFEQIYYEWHNLLGR